MSLFCTTLLFFVILSGVTSNIYNTILYGERLPVHFCENHGSTCEIKNIHYNKTKFYFKIRMDGDSPVIRVKESTLPKLGKFGVCDKSYYATGVNNVRELDLTGNNVEEIDVLAFKGCDRLKILILRDNKIEMLEDGQWNLYPELEKIDLTRNLIRELRSEVFANLTNLKELYLSGNYLRRFSPEVIEPCSNLEVLRLDSNDLLDLKETKIMKYMPKLKKVAFNNNQLRCDRVKDMIKIFKMDLIDTEYVEQVKESNDRTPLFASVKSIRCLADIPWAAAHYIYTHRKIMEGK